MRWDNLFDDLEGQLEQELTAEEVDLQAEEERLRLGRLSMRDRIISLHEAEGRGSGYTFRIVLVNGQAVDVRPTTFGRDWFAADIIAPGIQSQCIVPLVGIASLGFTREQIAVSMDAVPGETSGRSLAARLSLPFVLRDLCRRRSGLELLTITGSLYGTIDRVGRDHLDLALHERDAARRENVVTGYRIVPLTQIALVRL
jgi:hypothetical protein